MIKCPICKKQFKSLMSHIIRTHKMTISEFKEKYPKSKLVSDETKKKTSKTSKKNGCGKWRKGQKATEETKKKMSKAFSGKNNPFYGKKHTEKTKKRMSENHADFNGDKNPFKKWAEDKENKKQWLKSINERHQSVRDDPDLNRERRERLSKQTTQAHIDGKLAGYGRGHKSGYFYSKRQKLKIYYRSSYELKFLEWCEKTKEVKSFSPCNFSIKYDFDDMTKRYIPDFIINGIILIEIKPKSLIGDKQNKEKFKSGELYCKNNNMKYSIIIESDLQDLNKWIKNI